MPSSIPAARGLTPRAALALQLAGALLFWLALLLVQEFNWGRGTAKALILFAVLAATPFVMMLAERRRFPADTAAAPRPLVLAGALLLVLQTGYALKELRHPSLIDAATTTLAAGEVLRGGANPYTTALDPAAIALAGDARFGGYKYLPLTLAAYLPLGTPWGQHGVVATNLLLALATAWLIFCLAARLASPSAAWLALLVYLSLPLVPFQLFAKGATDMVAVLPLLAALLFVERRPGLAGFCLGLSLAAKPLPGALLLPCCLPALPRERRAYALGIAAGLAPVLPFLLWSPGALFDDVVRFNLVRPADSTSWLFAAPPLAGTLAHAALALLYLGIAAAVWRWPPSLRRRCGLAVTLILAAILTAPATHHNYQLWWLPLAAPILATSLAFERLPKSASVVYESGKTPA
jgi:hypothetical protein